MATRFYLPSSGTPDVTPPTPTGWDSTTGFVFRPTDTTKSGTAKAASTPTTVTAATPYEALDRAYVSPPFGAQTISGTFSAVVAGWSNSSVLSPVLAVHLKVISNNGQTVRGVLYDGDVWTSTTTTNNAINQKYDYSTTSNDETRIKSNIAITPVDCQTGDRLLIEIGIRKAGDTRNGTTTLIYGDPTGVADYAKTASLTTDLCPWVELSFDINFALSATFTNTLSMDTNSSFAIGGSGRSSSVLSLDGNDDGLSIGGFAQRSMTMAASAGSSLSIGAVRSRVSALDLSAPSSLSVQSMPQAAITLAGLGTFALSGSESRSIVWGSVSSSGLIIGPIRQQPAIIALQVVSGATIGNLRGLLAALTLTGSSTLVPNTGAAAAVAFRGTPTLLIPTTRQSYLRTLLLAGQSSLLVAVRVIADYHSEHEVRAIVLDSGRRLAVLLSLSYSAVLKSPMADARLFPSAIGARILDPGAQGTILNPAATAEVLSHGAVGVVNP